MTRVRSVSFASVFDPGPTRYARAPYIVDCALTRAFHYRAAFARAPRPVRQPT